MTIFERITNIPFYAILNAPITLMVAGKLFNVIIAYFQQEYLTSKDSLSEKAHDNGDHMCLAHSVLAGVLNNDDNNNDI